MQLTKDVELVNTRTITRATSIYTATDKYDLNYAGITGALGTLTAYYKYSYPVIDGPNQMQTLIHRADGYVSNLSEKTYKLLNVEPTWDTTAAYNSKASVIFHMESNLYGIWLTSDYVHYCRFDKYGVPRMSWG